MVKFLHTADWQIGKPFSNIEGDQGAFLRKQRIEMISRIGGLATEKRVDFVLVAGDVFDSNLPEPRSVMQAFKAMGESFSGKWILLPGNHDSAEVESIWTRIRRQFASDNIVCLDEPRAYRLPAINTVILSAPLKRRHEAQDLTEWFDDHVSQTGDIRIGLAHGSLDALSQYRGEASNTIALSRVETARLDYLALGDWHGTVLASKRAAYSGTPEPDRFKQNDSGNVLLISIEAAGSLPEIEIIPTKQYLWHNQAQNIYSQEDIAAIRQSIKDLNHPLDRIVLRLTLAGSISFDSRAQLEKEIELLSSELFYLETYTTGLLAQPSSDDLDEIEASGFVRNAVNHLLNIMNDKSDPQAETARMALHILFVENKKLV